MTTKNENRHTHTLARTHKKQKKREKKRNEIVCRMCHSLCTTLLIEIDAHRPPDSHQSRRIHMKWFYLLIKIMMKIAQTREIHATNEVNKFQKNICKNKKLKSNRTATNEEKKNDRTKLALAPFLPNATRIDSINSRHRLMLSRKLLYEFIVTKLRKSNEKWIDLYFIGVTSTCLSLPLSGCCCRHHSPSTASPFHSGADCVNHHKIIIW